MEGIIALAAIACVVTHLVCYIIVIVNMFAQEESLLHGLFALLCCQLYAFLWGWINWNSNKKVLVMGLWTLAVLLSIALPSATGGLR